jgi:type I restriction enzyme R subunit
MSGPEFALVEKPTIDFLKDLGYSYLPPSKNELARDGMNQVFLRDEFIEGVQRLNEVDEETAVRVYRDLLNVSDNERWLAILRGQYSRVVPGEATHQTIRVLDFLDPRNNRFTITNQFRVESEHPRVPDMVVFVNGIPLIVIEAKRPGSGKLHSAYEQIWQYEQQIPRLFNSNAFNIVTDRHSLRYGTTGAPWAYWGRWRDPWPRTESEFAGEFELGLWALLNPSRLLDVIAHFIVFEREPDTGRVVKKMCRHQQYRAASKLVARAQDEDKRRGLVWHTQGSGKSLTMVFSVLKLKMHRTLADPLHASPNILVITDRKDLDRQISGTFQACGLPNPRAMTSMDKLRGTIHSRKTGLTVLSTIHKFEGSRRPVENSGDWLIFVDEAHRTQEKDLGAFLRATFPDAWFFGFTGTPVKKRDLDTFQNFSPQGEGYLDRYSIDDAVRDGATVPIRYTSRKAEWQVDPAKLDILFDNWFGHEPEERLAAIKERGVTVADLAKHPQRVELIAYDLWAHFKGHALPDGYKAQIVAIDRHAVILYKRALDRVIADDLVRTEGLGPDDALRRAEAMSRPVYSTAQDDAKPSEDAWEDAMRADLRRYALDEQGEKDVISAFGKRGEPPHFLIVCNKLLTGFDAPLESVMYLDSPLKDHNLLQAIARTNRVSGEKKRFGLIVDYIGVTRRLDEALEAYRDEDVENVMRDLEVERDALRLAHRELFALIPGVRRHTGDLNAEYEALLAVVGGDEAVWYQFRRKADAFVRAYEALSPDPAILDYQKDLKWVVGAIQYLTPFVEKEVAPDLTGVSGKIRQLLEQHLDVTGLRTVVKVRQLTDPEFQNDFDLTGKTPKELRRATIRKATELKRITYDKKQQNPLRYGTFSERVLEVIRRFEQDQLDAAEALKAFEEITEDLQTEDRAHVASGLNKRAYGVLKILEAFAGKDAGAGEVPVREGARDGRGEASSGSARLMLLAEEIDAIYGRDETAPAGWHLKTELRRGLRSQVRYRAHQAQLEDVKEVAARVEDYALRHYARAS